MKDLNIEYEQPRMEPIDRQCARLVYHLTEMRKIPIYGAMKGEESKKELEMYKKHFEGRLKNEENN